MNTKIMIIVGMMVSCSMFAAPQGSNKFTRPYQGPNKGKALIRAQQQLRPQQQPKQSATVPPVGSRPLVVQPTQPAQQPVAHQQVTPQAAQVTASQAASAVQPQQPAVQPQRQSSPIGAPPAASHPASSALSDDRGDSNMPVSDDSDDSVTPPAPQSQPSSPLVALTPEYKQKIREHLQLIKNEIEAGNTEVVPALVKILRSSILPSLGVSQSSMAAVINAYQQGDLAGLVAGIESIVAQIPEVKRTWFQAIKQAAWNNSGTIIGLASALLLSPAIRIAQGYVSQGMVRGVDSLRTWWSGRKVEIEGAYAVKNFYNYFPKQKFDPWMTDRMITDRMMPGFVNSTTQPASSAFDGVRLTPSGSSGVIKTTQPPVFPRP